MLQYEKLIFFTNWEEGVLWPLQRSDPLGFVTGEENLRCISLNAAYKNNCSIFLYKFSSTSLPPVLLHVIIRIILK